jgi:hypothetical protein
MAPGGGEAARAAPSTRAAHLTDLLLDGLATQVVEGYSEGTPILMRDGELSRYEVGRDERDIRGCRSPLAPRVTV